MSAWWTEVRSAVALGRVDSQFTNQPRGQRRVEAVKGRSLGQRLGGRAVAPATVQPVAIQDHACRVTVRVEQGSDAVGLVDERGRGGSTARPPEIGRLQQAP